MRKVIAIGFLCLLGVGFYFYVGQVTNRSNVEKHFDENILTESVILHYLERDKERLVERSVQLQNSPDQITRFQALLTKMLYSVELEPDQVMDLMALQRNSYDEALLTLNPIDVQYQRLAEELNLYKSYGNQGLKIIGYRVVGPEFQEINGEQLAFVYVLYYLSLQHVIAEGEPGEGGNLYLSYIWKENDEKKWELKGFGHVDPFLTVE